MATKKPALNPYLNFNGNTAEAMKFYQSVLGGKLDMQTFGQAKMAKTPAEKDLIVHAALKSGVISIMASDGYPGVKVVFGDNIHMSLSGEDKIALNKMFTKLGQGGKVDMPLAKQFWGDTFGMVTDKFGVHWMVNITAKPQR
jgi:PhnB protein